MTSLLSSLYNRITSFFATHMWCEHLCGYTMMKRVHITCLFCRNRRELVETPIDKILFGDFKKDYVHNTVVLKIEQNMPIDGGVYIILINNRRRFAKAKSLILKRLLTIAEVLAN